MDSLERFRKAQRDDYDTALREIQDGRKVSHWMWYIFPQLRGLGESSMSVYYGIDGRREAEEYLKDDCLRGNLITITEALLTHKGKDIIDILGNIDSMKLRSCMTLFSAVSDIQLFDEVLDGFFGGEKDERTLSMLG